MSNVLLFRVPAETAERLRLQGGPGVEGQPGSAVVAEVAVDETTLFARMARSSSGERVGAIVLGPGVDDPGRLAARLREQDASVALFRLGGLDRDAGAGTGDDPTNATMEHIPEGDGARLAIALAECFARALRAALEVETGRRARAEADLEALREDAREAAAQRESLLGMVAHDIRAPLAVISGAVAELTHPSVGRMNDDQEALLSLVKKSVDRLHRLAVNLNAVAPTARSRSGLSRKTVDLAALVRGAVESARIEDDAQRVTVRCEVPPTVTEASVDGEKVTLLVASLVSSAVRCARTEVHVRLVTAAKVARIEVEDDGEAPSEDAAGDAFGHTHAGTSRSAQTRRSGGGIGPVLVRSIVAAHGGTLRAEKLSIDGVPRGARVVVSLPTHECGGREIVH